MLLDIPTVNEKSSLPTRKAKVDHRQLALDKLKELTDRSFFGTEKEIYNLSIIYDRLLLKYTGIKKHSLSPLPKVARSGKNWQKFRKLHSLLSTYNFPAELFIEVQFMVFAGKRKFAGNIYPFPSMLYGQWAEENYARFIQERIETETLESAFYTERSKIQQQIKDSIETISSFRKYNPDVTELQLLLMLESMLSPVYLITNKTFMRYINENNIDLPSDLISPLIRMQRDKQYYQTVLNVIAEMKGK